MRRPTGGRTGSLTTTQIQMQRSTQADVTTEVAKTSWAEGLHPQGPHVEALRPSRMALGGGDERLMKAPGGGGH